MALDTGSLLIGGVLGALLKGADLKAPSGLLNLGKLGSAFTDMAGNLYQTIKDSAGKIHIGNPLKGAGQVVRLAVDSTTGALRAVVKGAGNVWNALTDDYGNPITPTGIRAGKINSDGSFNWGTAISNEDIQKFTDAIAPTIRKDMRVGDEITGEVIDNQSLSPISTSAGTDIEIKTADNNEKMLSVIIGLGGGAILILLTVILLQKQRGSK